MSIETLSGVEELGGFRVAHVDGSIWFPEEKEPPHIIVDEKNHAISFRLQQGPIPENGENGCQVETIAHALKAIITGFQDKVPCLENLNAIELIDEVLFFFDQRTKDRMARGVEGTTKL